MKVGIPTSPSSTATVGLPTTSSSLTSIFFMPKRV
jgi:hypothetical protein